MERFHKLWGCSNGRIAPRWDNDYVRGVHEFKPMGYCDTKLLVTGHHPGYFGTVADFIMRLVGGSFDCA
ncbi:hypothetical protein D3C76_1778110 [compost metagenome]